MARGKSKNFNLPKIATLTVVILAVVGIGLTVLASQQQTNTQSEATLGNYGSLNDCNLNNKNSGGVQLYDGPNKTGDYRIKCASLFENSRLHLGSDTWAKGYDSIGNFNNKTDSLKVRINPGCEVKIILWNNVDENNKPIGQLFSISKNNKDGAEPVTIFKNLELDKRNKATFISTNASCN